MGMYDNIVCEMPLPGKRAAWQTPESMYQTKDTPEQYLATYTIRADGKIEGPDAETIHGSIEFYMGNDSGSWGDITYTRTGEDYESVSYTATVDRGTVVSIAQSDYAIGPAIPPKPPSTFTQEDRLAHEAKYAGPWVGRTIYVLWGGQDKGYYAEVIGESDRKVSLRVTEGGNKYHNTGDLETHHKSFGSTMFLSEGDAFIHRNARTDAYERATSEFKKYADEWHAKRAAINAEAKEVEE